MKFAKSLYKELVNIMPAKIVFNKIKETNSKRIIDKMTTAEFANMVAELLQDENCENSIVTNKSNNWIGEIDPDEFLDQFIHLQGNSSGPTIDEFMTINNFPNK